MTDSHKVVATPRVLLVCLLAIGVVALLPASSAHAQSTAEIKQLKEELQKQKAAVEAERKALEEQRRRLDETIQRLEQLESSAAAAPAKAAAEAEAETGGVKIAPTSSLTDEQRKTLPNLEIYGFAQADAIQDFKRMNSDWKATERPSKIPVVCPGDSGCGNDGETIISAKQSRFGVKGFVPTKLGDFKTQFEFDLFATGNDVGEHNFRLRHAWGSLGQVLAGQTNSLFMDGDVFPNTIDYWGPAGMIFLRNPQVRWTPYDQDGVTLAAAIEAPGSAIDEGKVAEVDPNLNVDPHNEYPDGTLQARYSGDWGHVQGSAIFRGVGYEVSSNPGGDPSGTKFGWGLSGSAGIHTIGKDRILLQLTYGEAIANYFNDGGNDIGPDGNLADAKTIPSLGWMAYYDRFWSDEWSSSVGYSEHRQNNTNGQADSSFKTGQYFSVNTLWTPLPNFMTGLEFLWGRRENNDENDESDTRIQLSFKYSFSGTIYGPEK
jgi:hypothetical protein